jgi:hypothetical protein
MILIGSSLILFAIPSKSYALVEFVEVQYDGTDLDFVVDVAESPDGRHVYAVGILDDAIAVFSRNATTGTLSFVEMQKDGVGGVDGLDAAISVTVSPDGKYVYAAGNLDDAIVVFSVDQDGDGAVDCHDDCPNDPGKTSPGACGCGVADTDTDEDGTLDCDDNCPCTFVPLTLNKRIVMGIGVEMFAMRERTIQTGYLFTDRLHTRELPFAPWSLPTRSTHVHLW